ncbi:hypothetical protein PIROE2DRAFT_9520 [Piromyces sp. E2]|nr:hypothetical protein PIROE2DRAFT_9520 [Piromyces sp. E2]|eukprot:OUM63851.1 hypothetical protein PIROE2DRAFT_9520 [Piromyces sp. E2]
MTNIDFKNNINDNKYDNGCIYLCNNLDIVIKDSNFTNNISKRNGGAIYLDNIQNLTLDLDSNIFMNNWAINGGALYFSNVNSNNEEFISDININNNKFINNYAQNFGGGIYSEYDRLHLSQSVTANEVTNNSAGIMGGGCYSPDNIQDNMFNLDNWKFNKNIVNTIENNYSTKPSYIKLNSNISKNNSITITSGDHISLNFSLYDEYDHIINDISQYYSISLKLELENDNNISQNTIYNSNYKLSGNIGTFIKGI